MASEVARSWQRWAVPAPPLNPRSAGSHAMSPAAAIAGPAASAADWSRKGTRTFARPALTVSVRVPAARAGTRGRGETEPLRRVRVRPRRALPSLAVSRARCGKREPVSRMRAPAGARSGESSRRRAPLITTREEEARTAPTTRPGALSRLRPARAVSVRRPVLDVAGTVIRAVKRPLRLVLNV